MLLVILYSSFRLQQEALKSSTIDSGKSPQKWVDVVFTCVCVCVCIYVWVTGLAIAGLAGVACPQTAEDTYPPANPPALREVVPQV